MDPRYGAMQILKKNSTSSWAARGIRNLLDHAAAGGQSRSKSHAKSAKSAGKHKETLKPKSPAEKYSLSRMFLRPSTRQLSTSPSPAVTTVTPRRKARSLRRTKSPTDLPAPFSQVNPFAINSTGQDLRRFLEEVGTDPKEARYWLRQFQQSTEPYNPFAVVEVDTEVFDNPDMMDSLGSCLSFLQRNNMKCVVIHGTNTPQQEEDLPLDMQVTRTELSNDSMMLVSVLESHGVMARPFFMGNGIFQANTDDSASHVGYLQSVNTDPIKWAMHTGHIPVLQSMGETDTGQIVAMDVCKVTAAVAKVLQPRKVLFINTTGGFVDDQGEPVPNVNLPLNWHVSPDEISWSESASDRVKLIGDMLSCLPQQSSVVITSATTLLTELFTHHGSGTFFKITGPIHKYQSLEEVDKERLQALINRSFGKDLVDDYFDEIETKLHSLYVSEDYNAAAIVTLEEGQSVPYLDKFAVGQAKQGEGTGEMLWARISKDFSQLFWRSRLTNRINPWYFKRCDGLWSSNTDWMVFWYGVSSHRHTSGLIDVALGLQSSFGESGKLSQEEEEAATLEVGTGEDNTSVD